jgi:putative ABC transport system permease protein
MVISQGIRLVGIGIVLGLAGSFAVTRVLSSLLLGVGVTDPVTFTSVAILLIAIALLACWIPARGATKIDPMIALRRD